MEKLSRHLWSMLLFVYSPPTKNSAVDSLCQLYWLKHPYLFALYIVIVSLIMKAQVAFFPN
jgi:hypothetical protein